MIETWCNDRLEARPGVVDHPMGDESLEPGSGTVDPSTTLRPRGLGRSSVASATDDAALLVEEFALDRGQHLGLGLRADHLGPDRIEPLGREVAASGDAPANLAFVFDVAQPRKRTDRAVGERAQAARA